MVPDVRIRRVNDAPVREDGAYVLYWMVAYRRLRSNFALDRAVELAAELGKPVLVFEALRIDYPHANHRLHAFVLDGMRANADAAKKGDVGYYAYVEPKKGAGKGLLRALSKDACAVVTDEYPCFFIPEMQRAAAKQLDVSLQAVDGAGLLPLRATDRAYPTAYAFRRFLQKTLPDHLEETPRRRPLRGVKRAPLPRSITNRWPPASAALLRAEPKALAALPLDGSVAPTELRGGATAAAKRLRVFVREALDGYAERRNDPSRSGTSRLSPYLHFGHIGTHEVFQAIARHEDWSPKRLAATTDGKRSGWWNMSESAEAFLDQVVTWRELGWNFGAHRDDAIEYDSLPDWALKTLEEHAKDARPHLYSRKQLEHAETSDEIWNAAQRELVQEGRIHNYLRMLWGKKILQWSRSPRDAAETMIHLNDKYALDGRDPNSYSGIFWVLGRYDRPWGPERPVFGKIRYMTSENTARKLNLAPYLRRYGAADSAD